jgi:hypothetical protein
MEQSKLLRQNTAEFKAALQDATVYRDRRTFARLAQLAVTGEVARLIARLLVCCFFLNLVYSEVETWWGGVGCGWGQKQHQSGLGTPRAFEQSTARACVVVCCLPALNLFMCYAVLCRAVPRVHTHTVEAQEKMLRWREPGLVLRPLPFPIFHTAVVLPSALLVAAGVLPWLFGLVLLGCIVWRDARLTWVMLSNVLLHKGQPPELLMKQLAMIGSTLLVIALSARCAHTEIRVQTQTHVALLVERSQPVMLLWQRAQLPCS